MDIVEPVRRLAERATGIGIPSRDEALSCVRNVRPSRMKFRDDGYIPNNPKFPLLHYRKVLQFVASTIPPLSWRRCSTSTVGERPGATGFMIMSTITR
jgi:hypothetical protein